MHRKRKKSVFKLRLVQETSGATSSILALQDPRKRKERGIQDQEVQRVPNKGNPKRPTPRYFLIKIAKVKD